MYVVLIREIRNFLPTRQSRCLLVGQENTISFGTLSTTYSSQKITKSGKRCCKYKASFAMTRFRKVSVIVPCFNHGEFLREAAGSVTNSRREDIELIVVDDGSTDERTRKEMDTLRAQAIKVIRQENKGLGAARNAGVAASQGEYLFPLDADDRLRSEWIDRGIGILNSDPNVGVVYGDAQCFGTRTDR